VRKALIPGDFCKPSDIERRSYPIPFTNRSRNPSLSTFAGSSWQQSFESALKPKFLMVRTRSETCSFEPGGNSYDARHSASIRAGISERFTRDPVSGLHTR
jgi:hypothetical protein